VGRAVLRDVKLINAMVTYPGLVPLDELLELIGSFSAEATPLIGKQHVQISFGLLFGYLCVHPTR
jgi:hypothetical protein